jgi:hypothetical protein
MNDFSDTENQLKRLRPMAASDQLAARIERALAEAEDCRASVPDAAWRERFLRWNWRFTETPYKLSLGLGVAAAALLLIFAHLKLDRPNKATARIASAPSTSSAPLVSRSSAFLPEGLTRVVYNTRDEGLHFQSGTEQPVRRLRSSARETLQWRNPNTGASLRVSYPSEEVSLVPVSGH